MDSPIKQLIVLDDIRDRLEMIDSDIKPGSFVQPVEAGTQQVAANIYSQNGSSYNGQYTTLPLSPLSGNVHDVDKSFIHTVFTMNFNISVQNKTGGAIGAKGTAGSLIKLMVGPRDTASLFSRIDFMIGGTAIFSTTFQQLESAIGLASLPSDVVEHSPMYATVSKLLDNKQTPMQLVVLDIAGLKSEGGGKYSTFNVALKYDLTIDLNRLMIPLSDIHFITKNMGQITLRLYFTDLHQSFYFMHLPDGFTSASNQGVNGIAQLCPIIWNTKQYAISSGLAAPAADKYNLIQFNTTLYKTDDADGSNLIPYSPQQNLYFFQLNNVEICQACFTIEEDSYRKLEEFFLDNAGKVIIPIHILNTSLFSNGNSIDGSSYPTTLNAQVSNQNITKLFVSQFLQSNWSAILNPYFSNFTLYYNGMPINQKPYEKINDRAIADFTQTMLDTDSQEINDDYLASLSFGSGFTKPTTSGAAGVTGTISKQDDEYFAKEQIDNYVLWRGSNGYDSNFIRLSHLCPLAFSTAVDGSFQTGLCVNAGGAGAGTQQVRLQNTTPYTNDTWKQNVVRDGYTIPNAVSDPTNIAISAYLDACIILQFDPVRHYCARGELSFVRPFVPVE